MRDLAASILVAAVIALGVGIWAEASGAPEQETAKASRGPAAADLERIRQRLLAPSLDRPGSGLREHAYELIRQRDHFVRGSAVTDGYIAWAVGSRDGEALAAAARSGAADCDSALRGDLWTRPLGARALAWAALPFILADRSGGPAAARERYHDLAPLQAGQMALEIRSTCLQTARVGARRRLDPPGGPV